MNKKTLLYIGNHEVRGVIDYIYHFRLIYGSEVVVSKKLSYKYSKVIFIENFQVYKIIEYLKVLFFLKKFKGEKVLVLTEFLREIRPGKLAFNSFDDCFFKSFYKSNFYSKFTASFFFVIFFLTNILTNYSSKLFGYVIFFFKLCLKNLFYITLEKCKIIFFLKIKRYFNKIIKHHKDSISRNYLFFYFLSRCHAFINLKNYFDIFLLSHEKLLSKKIKKLNLKKIYTIDWIANPKKIIIKKNFLISFSGYINSYRINVCNSLNYNKKIFNKNFNLIKINKTNFVKQLYKKENLVFSIHPKKSYNWKYSSPTRYINSIRKGEVPIIVDKFKEKNILALDASLLNLKSKKKIIKKIKIFKKNLEKKYKSNIKG